MVEQYLPQTNKNYYSILQWLIWFFLLFLTSSKHSQGRNSRKPAAKRKAQQHRHSTAAVFKRTRHRPLNPLPLSHLELISLRLPPSAIFLGCRASSKYHWLPPISLACAFPSPVGVVLLFQCETASGGAVLDELDCPWKRSCWCRRGGRRERIYGSQGRYSSSPSSPLSLSPRDSAPRMQSLLLFFILCPSIHSSVDFAGCRGGKLREFGRRRWWNWWSFSCVDPQRQGRTSGCLRIFLVLQIRKVSCAPSLMVFLSPFLCLTSSSVSFLSRFFSRFVVWKCLFMLGLLLEANQ